MELNQPQQQKEKRMENSADSLRGIWDNIKQTKIHNTGLPEGKERQKGAEILFEETIAEFSLTYGKKTDMQIQEAPSSK